MPPSDQEGQYYAGLPPRYQVDTKPQRKDEPLRPENVITPEKVAHFPKEVYITRTFLDHRGEQCISVWRDFHVPGSQEAPIPPWSYQFYVVTELKQPEAEALIFDLYKKLINDLSYNEIVHMRFDFTFLPGAGNVACMEHYWAEKASSRQEGEFAIVSSYEMVGRAKGCSAENALIVVDCDPFVEGLVWLKFANRQAYPEGVPEAMNQRSARSTLNMLDSNWVGSPMEEIYRQSAVREELEKRQARDS